MAKPIFTLCGEMKHGKKKRKERRKMCSQVFVYLWNIYSVAEVATAIDWNPLSNDEHFAHFALEIKLFPHTNVM